MSGQLGVGCGTVKDPSALAGTWGRDRKRVGMTSITCAFCSEQFDGHRNARYCSAECRVTARRAKEGSTCFVCGDFMPLGPNSAPQGQAKHQNCVAFVSRRVANPQKLLCSHCGQEFQSGRGTAKYCSRPCKEKAKNFRRFGLTCYVCNLPMFAGQTSLPQGEAAHLRCKVDEHGKYCRCEDCRKQYNAHQREYLSEWRKLRREIDGVSYNTTRMRRLRDKYGVSTGWISGRKRLEIYERDRWTCQICGEPLDLEGHWNDPHAPSLDHIQPRSLGGSDNLENLRAAGRHCNMRRGAPEDWDLA